jgi:hypothetical protein
MLQAQEHLHDLPEGEPVSGLHGEADLHEQVVCHGGSGRQPQEVRVEREHCGAV